MAQNCSDSIVHVQENAFFTTYHVMPYPYIILGVMGHGLMFIGCKKQLRNEPGYLYPTFSAATRLVEILTETMLVFSFRFSGAEDIEGAAWFRSSAFLMYYSAYLCVPLADVATDTSLFLSLCVALDRMYAMLKPFHYKQTMKQSYRAGSYALCILVAVSAEAYNTMRMWVSYDNETGLYKIEQNFAYRASQFANVMINVRNGVTVSALFALIICNALVVRTYRKKIVQPGAGLGTGSQTEAKKKETQKTLFVFAVSQATCSSFTVGVTALFYLVVYLPAEIFGCAVDFMASCVDAIIMITCIMDVYVPCMTSASFRRVVLSGIRKKENSSVVPQSSVRTVAISTIGDKV